MTHSLSSCRLLRASDHLLSVSEEYAITYDAMYNEPVPLWWAFRPNAEIRNIRSLPHGEASVNWRCSLSAAKCGTIGCWKLHEIASLNIRCNARDI